jgi:hypothetical protein
MDLLHGFKAIGVISCALLFADPAVAADAAQSSGNSSVGFDLHEKVGVKEIGLPIYPGSILKHDRDHDKNTPSVSLGLWGGAFGLRLVVLEYASNARLDAIADFYRDALARYGPVIDCSDTKSDEKVKAPVPNGIECEDDHPKIGGRLYKSGTENSQHVVEINPHGGDVEFSLLRIELKGTD